MNRREFTGAIRLGMIAAMSGLDSTIGSAQATNPQPAAPPPTNAPRLQIGAAR